MALTANTALPWLIDVDVFEQAVSHVNWNSVNINANELLNGDLYSSGAQNAEWNADVVLAAGTWAIEVLYRKESDKGICSVQLDGVESGTIDMYNSTVLYNNRTTISAVSVATTAKTRLKLKMATKNASSSNYQGMIQHIQLRRTA